MIRFMITQYHHHYHSHFHHTHYLYLHHHLKILMPLIQSTMKLLSSMMVILVHQVCHSSTKRKRIEQQLLSSNSEFIVSIIYICVCINLIHCPNIDMLSSVLIASEHWHLLNICCMQIQVQTCFALSIDSVRDLIEMGCQ